jgi:hypothetical protein
MQTSFKDVRCINSGAIPLPRHGRQVAVDESQIKDEEVWDSLDMHNRDHPFFVLLLHYIALACMFVILLA